ncbi:MAG: TonB-dependent receptor [Bacteroidaceae bacterium]|nr:TonB-dependent receptor [Bacteroidaceae bacterium]
MSRPNFNRTVLFGGRVKAMCDWIGGRSSAALEVRNEDLTSTSLGDSLAVKHEIGDSEGLYVLGRVRTLLSLNVEHSVAYRRLSVSGGFMAHKDLKGSTGMHVYPGVDVSYRLRRDWRVYASWNTSMRMPSFTELYYSVDGHKADRNLKAERMQAVEIGSKYASEYGEGLVSLYYHDGRDMIDWIMDMSKLKEERIWTSVNHAQIHSFGIELSGRLDFTKLCPSWRVLKSISLGYSHIWQKQKKEGEWLSRYALEYLRNKLVAATHFHIYENRGRRQSADVWLHYRLNDRVGEYTDAAGKVHGYEPYSVLDVHARWRMRYVDFHIEANNILNKKYVDYGNVVQPGIWIIGGVRVFF